jgi:hypothetical protein
MTCGSKRKDALRSVGAADDTLDQLVSTDQWDASERHTIFEKDFEQSMRSHFSQYSELEAQAKECGIDSKPFVARWVGERLDPNSDDRGWEKVGQMAEYLKRLIPQQSASQEGTSA